MLVCKVVVFVVVVFDVSALNIQPCYFQISPYCVNAEIGPMTMIKSNVRNLNVKLFVENRMEAKPSSV